MWSDLTPSIRDRFVRCLPLYKRAVVLCRDPAVQALGICPESAVLFLRQSGELTAIAQSAASYFSKISWELPNEDMILLKRADVPISTLTHPLSEATQSLQRAIGGPNALTNSLVGGALGGLGGYAVGSIYDHLVPRALKRIVPGGEDSVGETHMATLLGLGGAGLGALPGIGRGATNMLNRHNLQDSWLGQSPWANDSGELLAKSADLNPVFLKAASETGALFLPSIPVDAFNRAIWSDTGPANPFGTRSSWGDNSQTMRTPPSAAASVGGLVAATGIAKNSPMVSPWDIACVAANAGINAGLGGVTGAATGLATGKILGVLAGLTPSAQQYVQRTGLWAGVVSGLARSLF